MGPRRRSDGKGGRRDAGGYVIGDIAVVSLVANISPLAWDSTLCMIFYTVDK